jgi:gas vesicle protein
MKYGKLIKGIFAQRSNNNAQVAIAIVAGLAAGAVISILFAPESGSDVRKGIADQAKGLGTGLKDKYNALKDRVVGGQEIDESIERPEVPHFTHTPQKKRKSDIKDIIHDAHTDGHTEQPIS